jgi:hypothetical protein
MVLPQLLAGLDVEKRHGEEDDGEQQHVDILHGQLSGFSSGTGCSRTYASASNMILARDQHKY